jgi:hypothetical protein
MDLSFIMNFIPSIYEIANLIIILNLIIVIAIGVTAFVWLFLEIGRIK